MSKLFIVPYIVPDIVFFIRYRRNEPSISKDGIRYRRKTFDIEEKTFDIGPDIQNLHAGQISKVFLQYRRNDLQYRRFYPSLPPEIEGLYSISVAISNTSRTISSIYRCRAPLSNQFDSISTVSSINIFHISISCTICDADIGYHIVLTC